MGDTAVVVTREDQRWDVTVLPERYGESLDSLIAALRAQPPGQSGVIGLVNVADEFFVAVRLMGDEERLLLSDVTASVAWDVAAQAVDRLGVDRPGDEDLDEVLPAGDLSIFADLGLDEMELGMMLSDLDAYADETLLSIARRLGFGEAYERALESAVL